MLIGDKIIDDQGNVRTVGSAQDARLYYEDLEGNRKKYLLEGEAGLPPEYVATVNGLSGNVTLTTSDIENDSGYITTDNIPVSSVNGQVGNVLLDVHDIKYETVSGLILSSYTYYTVSSTLTGTIQYSIPSGLHDTMVKFTTGPSAEFAISVDEKMQLNKEFNFEGDKSYVLAVDNGMVFWNELTEELDPPSPEEWVFEITGSSNSAVNGRYKRTENYDPSSFTPMVAIYLNENGNIMIYGDGLDGYIGNNGDTTSIIYTLNSFSLGSNYTEPWNLTTWPDDITITPIV